MELRRYHQYKFELWTVNINPFDSFKKVTAAGRGTTRDENGAIAGDLTGRFIGCDGNTGLKPCALCGRPYRPREDECARGSEGSMWYGAVLKMGVKFCGSE